MDIAIILNCPNLVGEIKEENVIFTDGGYKFIDSVKEKTILAVVGDFDTLDKIPENENVVKLEREKNFTDGEYAIVKAKEFGGENVTIYGANGGKLEHILGNISLLAVARKLKLNAKIVDGNCTVHLVKGKNKFKVKKGSSVSILPFNKWCVVNNSKNLYYPLKNLKLTNDKTRGISNVATEEEISFNVVFGLAIVIIYNER